MEVLRIPPWISIPYPSSTYNSGCYTLNESTEVKVSGCTIPGTILYRSIFSDVKKLSWYRASHYFSFASIGQRGFLVTETYTRPYVNCFSMRIFSFGFPPDLHKKGRHARGLLVKWNYRPNWTVQVTVLAYSVEIS
jgi:hypothetical protein